MNKDEFLRLVNEHWSPTWDDGQRNGDPGFGVEDSLDDWLGSIAAFMALNPDALIAARRRVVPGGLTR
jgi:hypothetical protein